MNEIKESLLTYFSNWFTNFSSNFNSTEIKGNVEKSLNVDVDKFLSSLTEINSTLSGHIVLILDQVYAGEFSETLNIILEKLSEGFGNFVNWLEVTDFQLRLLRELSFILLGNFILVLIAWKIYGARIAAKFGVARGSRHRIEELRTSMSELQLPKEHDFKFK